MPCSTWSTPHRAAEQAADLAIPLLELTLHRRSAETLSGILSVDKALALALEVVHQIGDARVSDDAA